MTTDRIKELTSALNLKEMNLESGLFNVLGVSDISLDAQRVNNVIYLMLTAEMPQSYLHHMMSDDVQILIEGGPVDYYLFHDDGTAKKVVMGRDVAKGESPIVVAPGGTAKALVLHEEAEHLLIGSVVSPAWSPSNTRYGFNDDFLDKFEATQPWADRAFLRKLIGPNFETSHGGDDNAQTFYLNDMGEVIYQGMQLTDEQFLLEATRLESIGEKAELIADRESPRLTQLKAKLLQRD